MSTSAVPLDALPVGALLVEPRRLRIIDANPRAVALFRRPLVDLNLPLVLPEFDRARLLRQIERGAVSVSFGVSQYLDLYVGIADDDGALLITVVETTDRVRNEWSLRRAFLTQKTLSDLVRSTLDDRPLAAQLREGLSLLTDLPWVPFGPRAMILVEKEGGLEPVAVGSTRLAVQGAETPRTRRCACGENVFVDGGPGPAALLFGGISLREELLDLPLVGDAGLVGRLLVQCSNSEDRDPFEMELLQVVAGHLTNVIVHVQARGEAQRQAESFRELTRGAVSAIVAIDAWGRISGFNPAAEAMFGYSAHEVLGTSIALLVPGGFPSRCVEDSLPIEPVPITPAPARELTAYRADGHRIPVHFELFATFAEGRVGYTAFIRDETERVRTRSALVAAREEAVEASRTKSRFLANMSHEIRTPMNGVIGMTDNLLATPLDDDQRDAVETIRSSGEALLTVINDVLDFSRIEAGRLEIVPAPFPLARVPIDVTRILSGIARGKGIDLQLEMASRLPAWVLGDAGRIRQILVNIVGNAVKFTERGQVTVGVEIGTRHDEVCFRVQDTGIGMTQDSLQRLFKPFVQADGSITRRFGGTGLGLAISRQLAELMGGVIAATSIPNEGSVFTIRLPLPATEAQTEISTADLSRIDFAERTALLVEDNLVNQKVARRMLERLGFTVTVAGHGGEALEKAEGVRFDVIFMDCQMPVLDGFQATRALRARGNATPIVALTANAMTGDEEACLAVGMNGFLSKPVRQQDVEAMLARVLATP